MPAPPIDSFCVRTYVHFENDDRHDVRVNRVELNGVDLQIELKNEPDRLFSLVLGFQTHDHGEIVMESATHVLKETVVMARYAMEATASDRVILTVELSGRCLAGWREKDLRERVADLRRANESREDESTDESVHTGNGS